VGHPRHARDSSRVGAHEPEKIIQTSAMLPGPAFVSRRESPPPPASALPCAGCATLIRAYRRGRLDEPTRARFPRNGLTMGYPFESGGAVSAALRPEPGWAQPGTRGRPRGAARGGTDLRASRGPSPPSLAVSDRAGAQAPHLSEMENPFRAKRDGPVHWLDARAATGARPARSVLPNAAPGPVAHERRHERYR
jgi:hypothetical protein